MTVLELYVHKKLVLSFSLVFLSGAMPTTEDDQAKFRYRLSIVFYNYSFSPYVFLYIYCFHSFTFRIIVTIGCCIVVLFPYH